MNIEMRDARVLAEQYITERISPPSGGAYTIVDAAIRASYEGWLFPYQAVRLIATGDIEYSVVGNGPILVTKIGTVIGPQRPGR